MSHVTLYWKCTSIMRSNLGTYTVHYQTINCEYEINELSLSMCTSIVRVIHLKSSQSLSVPCFVQYCLCAHCPCRSKNLTLFNMLVPCATVHCKLFTTSISTFLSLCRAKSPPHWFSIATVFQVIFSANWLYILRVLRHILLHLFL